jgi:hypothetical protein
MDQILGKLTGLATAAMALHRALEPGPRAALADSPGP